MGRYQGSVWDQGHRTVGQIAARPEAELKAICQSCHWSAEIEPGVLLGFTGAAFALLDHRGQCPRCNGQTRLFTADGPCTPLRPLKS